MKKFAFTLSEIIVALGIIGVIAAMTAPLMGNIIPDKDKIKVLKVNKLLNDVNAELLDDPGLYVSDGICENFGCTQQPTRPPYNEDARFRGFNKYLNLLVENLNITAVGNNLGATGRFITADGIVWVFETFTRRPSANPLVVQRNEFTYGFYIDLDPNGDDCSYSAECQKPDRFRFTMDHNGVVSAADPLTRAYLANPEKLNDRKKDLKDASTIYAD